MWARLDDWEPYREQPGEESREGCREGSGEGSREALRNPPRFPWGGRIGRVHRDQRMTFPPDGQSVQIRAGIAPNPTLPTRTTSDTPAERESQPILLLEEDVDPEVVVLTCANCGAAMNERKCKLICLSETSSAGSHHFVAA
jgi:hypothetical protein